MEVASFSDLKESQSFAMRPFFSMLPHEVPGNRTIRDGPEQDVAIKFLLEDIFTPT